MGLAGLRMPAVTVMLILCVSLRVPRGWGWALPLLPSPTPEQTRKALVLPQTFCSKAEKSPAHALGIEAHNPSLALRSMERLSVAGPARPEQKAVDLQEARSPQAGSAPPPSASGLCLLLASAWELVKASPVLHHLLLGV